VWCSALDKSLGEKMAEKKCIHEGHRQRLMKTVHEVGLYGLSDIQKVEFLLFYIFPRGDVNPLSHRLLDRFGNIANIIDAEVEELMEIDGIGERGARAIVCLRQIFEEVTDSRSARYASIEEVETFCDYFEELLRFLTVENMYIIGIDNDFKVLQKKRLTEGSVKNVGIVPQRITSFAVSSKATGIILAHNHPNGSCMPSDKDIESTEKLRFLLNTLGVTLVEHVIVGSNGIYGIIRNKLLRKY
jgi:DNA repair protein RadC